MVSCRETGSVLHSALTGFVNCLLQGEIHPSVSPVLFRGNLIALEKKTGGVRPTAIGYTVRAAKCANSFAASQLKDYFSPIQLGVGTPGGCEAAVHATRRYIEALPESHVVVKINYKNAFNTLRRDLMLQSVASAVPGIYRFCHLSYSQSSILKLESRTLLSQEGPQVIHWARSCSVSLYTSIYYALSQSLSLVSWMILLEKAQTANAEVVKGTRRQFGLLCFTSVV